DQFDETYPRTAQPHKSRPSRGLASLARLKRRVARIMGSGRTTISLIVSWAWTPGTIKTAGKSGLD
ncbi:uncharacterized protein PGTG_21157, partial [Puccinia graminis f. sp. tritici CRL 75-36-700-3]